MFYHELPPKISLPTEYNALLDLTQNVLDKHKAAGAETPFPTSVIETISQTLEKVAATTNKLAAIQAKIKANVVEYYTILGIDSQAPPKADNLYRAVKDAHDAILDMYDQNDHSLAQYGFRVKITPESADITIPTTPKELNRLAAQIVKRAAMEGKYNDLSEELLHRLVKLAADGEAMLQKNKQLEKLYQKTLVDRDSLVGIAKRQHHKTPNTLRFYLLAARDAFMRVYRDQTEELRKIGFIVTEQ